MNRRASLTLTWNARYRTQQLLLGGALCFGIASPAHAQTAAQTGAAGATPPPQTAAQTVAPSAAPAPAAAPAASVAPAAAVTPGPAPQAPAAQPPPPPQAAPSNPAPLATIPAGYVLVPEEDVARDRRHRRRTRAPRASQYDAARPLPEGMVPPPVFRYTEGTPLPAGYHLEPRANRGLIQGGVVTIAIPYLASAIVGLGLELKSGSSWLLLPVVGPWITLATRRTHCSEIGDPTPTGIDCFGDEFGAGLLIADGAVQLLGTLLVTWGALATRDYAVIDNAKLRVTPLHFANGGYGIALHGAL